MSHFKRGDLIAKKHCATQDLLQIGIVIWDDVDCFDIQWTWYNKVFFMEKEGDIFKDLNNTHLLSTVRYLRLHPNPFLCHLGDNYMHGSKENILNAH
tara:strand:- start:1696 stop:1986 length:291 start_codon:yes stop_codon:yes gene_type:complete